MADEDDVAEDETEDGAEKGDGGKKPKKKSKKPKKSKTKMYVILGLLVFVGLSAIVGVVVYHEWQKRQLAKQWDAKPLTEEEKAALEEEKKDKAVEEIVTKEKVKRAHFDECKQMTEQYTTPKGWHYATLSQQTLLGLPKYANDKAVDQRCIEFARIVGKMENMARHKRHVFMCKNSIFKLPGGYFFEVDPKGQGMLHGHEAIPNEKKLIAIKPGKTKLFAQWQFYNVGDGCNVIGFSKMRGQVFTMSGAIEEKKE